MFAVPLVLVVDARRSSYTTNNCETETQRKLLNYIPCDHGAGCGELSHREICLSHSPSGEDHGAGCGEETKSPPIPPQVTMEQDVEMTVDKVISTSSPRPGSIVGEGRSWEK